MPEATTSSEMEQTIRRICERASISRKTRTAKNPTRSGQNHEKTGPKRSRSEPAITAPAGPQRFFTRQKAPQSSSWWDASATAMKPQRMRSRTPFVIRIPFLYQ